MVTLPIHRVFIPMYFTFASSKQWPVDRKGSHRIRAACQNKQIEKTRMTDHAKSIVLASGCPRVSKTDTSEY